MDIAAWWATVHGVAVVSVEGLCAGLRMAALWLCASALPAVGGCGDSTFSCILLF